jgi:hypothetical protein
LFLFEHFIKCQGEFVFGHAVLLRMYPFVDVKNAAYYKQKSGGCPLFDAFGIELLKDSSIEVLFTQGLPGAAFLPPRYPVGFTRSRFITTPGLLLPSQSAL